MKTLSKGHFNTLIAKFKNLKHFDGAHYAEDTLYAWLKPYLNGHECEYGWNAETTKEGTIITVTNKGELVFEHRCAHPQPERRKEWAKLAQRIAEEYPVGSDERFVRIYQHPKSGFWWDDRRNKDAK